MNARRSVLLCALCALLAAPSGAGALSLLPGQTANLVSIPGTDTPLPATAEDSGIGFDDGRSVSADGRYVVFVSDADAMAGDDDDRPVNVYRHDTQTGATILVSRANGPQGVPGDANSSSPSISDSGDRVAFISNARLDPVADDDAFADVYVRFIGAGETHLVSRAQGVAGVQANSSSEEAEISGDGLVVAFRTSAGNLGPVDSDGDFSDVYARRLDTHTVELVSRTDADANLGGLVGELSVNTDGSRIAFTSNLEMAGEAADSSATDVFVRDTTAGATVLVSRTAAGANVTGFAGSPSISGDGAVVAFHADGAYTADDADVGRDVFLRANNATTLVSRAADGGQQCEGMCGDPVVTTIGPEIFVTYRAQGAPLLAGTSGTVALQRQISGGTTTVSRADGAAGQVVAPSRHGAARGNRDVVFATSDPAAVPGDSPDFSSVALRRVVPGATILVSRPTGGGDFTRALNSSEIPGGVSAPPSVAPGGGPVITPDGRFVLLVSDADALLPPGLPVGTVRPQLFRRDLLTGEVALVSRATGADGPPSAGSIHSAAISADGRFVAFGLTDGTLAATFGAGAESQVYRRDLQTGQTILVSRADGPGGSPAAGLGAQGFSGIAMSADGNRVAFVSGAPGMAAGQVSSAKHIFVRDIAAGDTALVSRASGANGANFTGDSADPAMNADGTRVAFATETDDLDGSPGTSEPGQVIVRDTASGTTAVASVGPGGVVGNDQSVLPTIDAAGGRVAFSSRATNLDPSDPGANDSAYVRDLAAAATEVVGRANGATGSVDTAPVRWVRLSPDGGHVLFVSSGELTPGDTVGTNDVFVRSLAGDTTARVALGPGGTEPTSARAADLSADARCVIFDTLSGSIQAGSPTSGDFFLIGVRALTAQCPVPVPVADPPAGPGAGPAPGPQAPAADTLAPTVSGLALSPRRFRVKGLRLPAGRGRAAPAGSTLRLLLSETAALRLVFERQAAGRRVGARCLVPTPARAKRRPCVRFIAAGALTRLGQAAGTRRIPITGKVGRRALKPGVHRLSVTAVDAAGNRSAVRRVRFTIVRR